VWCGEWFFTCGLLEHIHCHVGNFDRISSGSESWWMAARNDAANGKTTMVYVKGDVVMIMQ